MTSFKEFRNAQKIRTLYCHLSHSSSPLELYFEFSCLEGESDGNGNGEVAIRFMLNLKQLGYSSTSEHVGFTTEVEIKELLRFLEVLEMEWSSCLANYSLNGQDSRLPTPPRRRQSAFALALGEPDDVADEGKVQIVKELGSQNEITEQEEGGSDGEGHKNRGLKGKSCGDACGAG